ncbi:class C sortase [Enterococcus devriesei]|uniref:class C sortase n=1 Tax=Enterococcus devriesei TaxID=319970 RepID=UPI00288E2559|nr:class C sortase [Enterococcus devriesei]MDT2821110.1 class C sortase [Enterococcus devriesei]
MKQKQKKKRLLLDVVMMVVLLIGICALLYPFVSDSLNNILDQQMINYYQHKANSENETTMKQAQAAMEKKNQELAANGNNPGADPWSDKIKKKKVPEKPTQDYFKQHTIGVIDIPKLKIKLPIFDQTNDLFLSKGTSLLEGTSYPNGGANTHAVISGHRGLPEAKLFTDLPELKMGNKFYLHINQQIHAYQVDQIKVVEPTNTDYLHIEQGKDLVTLLTCTPYMINSHRLLVRGHRVPYVPSKDDKKLNQGNRDRWLKLIGILGGAFLLVLLLLYGFYRWLKAVRIANRRYLLRLTIVDEDHQPIAHQSFTLYSRNGRHKVYRDGKPLTGISDELGIVELEAVKGGRYRLKTEGGDKIKVLIKKINDEQFYLTPLKHSNFSVLDQNSNLFQFNRKEL